MATIKQKKAFDKTVENCGNVSKSMKEVGYSKATAKNPKVLTGSKGWEELMEQYLPDKLLAEKHKELLEIPKKIRTFVKGDLTSEYEELDSQAISKGLDMGYKLKGHYAAEKRDITSLGEKIIPIYGGQSTKGISLSGHDSSEADIPTE